MKKRTRISLSSLYIRYCTALLIVTEYDTLLPLASIGIVETALGLARLDFTTGGGYAIFVRNSVAFHAK